jgi:hypothetical protein
MCIIRKEGLYRRTVYVAQDYLCTSPIGLASFWPNNVCVLGSGLHVQYCPGLSDITYIAQNACIAGTGLSE